MAFNTQLAIMAQNSATAAATVVAALVASGDADAFNAFEDIRTAIFEGTLALADGEIEGVTENAGGFRSSGGGTRPDDAGAGVPIKFGKYQGKTIAEVYAEDAGYIKWLAREGNNDFLRGKAAQYLASLGVSSDA